MLFNKKSLLIGIFVLLTSFAYAAATIPVTINTVTFSGNTVTVTTAAAHSITVNQPGFCIVGSSVTADNVCSTATTVPSATQFTFTLSTGAACSASCGTSAPGKLFVLGAVSPFNQQGTIQLTFCVWTYTANGVIKSGATSACASSAQESAAIAAGSTVESIFTLTLPSNWTLAKADSFATDLQNSMQAALNAGVPPGAVLGKFCDVGGCN